MRKAWLFFAGLVWLGGVSYAQEPALKIGTVVPVDPSSVPVPNEVNHSKAYGERWRLMADLNFDGIPDLLISDEKRSFGNGGGNWNVYLGTRDGRWKFIGTLSAHPMAMNLQKRSLGQGLLTAYWHEGASAGDLLRYLITTQGIQQEPSRTLHPNDDGIAEDQQEYRSYFSNPSRLHFQNSQTGRNGKVAWMNETE